jgi:hypothetical protein
MSSLIDCLNLRNAGLNKPCDLQRILSERGIQHIAQDRFSTSVLVHQTTAQANPRIAYCHQFIALGHGVSTSLWDYVQGSKLWDYISPILPSAPHYNSYMCRTVYLDDSKRVLQVYISSEETLKMEIIEKGNLIASRCENSHPKKMWFHRDHVFFTTHTSNQYWLCVWKMNQEYTKKYLMLNCDRDTYQDVEPIYNERYFVISAGEGLSSSIFVYDMKADTFKAHDLDFSKDVQHSIQTIQLKNSRVYVSSYYITNRIKYQITVYNLEKERVEERFCRGLNGVCVGLKLTPTHLLYRVFDRGESSLYALDLTGRQPRFITILPLIEFESSLIFVEGNLINLFFNSPEHFLLRMVIDYEAAKTLNTIAYSKERLFERPFFHENVMVLPYYNGAVEFYIENFNSFDSKPATRRLR